ncbi:hypothetical protein MA16_Dca022484 [Dendrobium catenatum]|uniref:RNase H type-1 domain-containing protein n=1 Tax=Dendrobium catenatum TaxID=906689 RepID=A0A2I0XG04_9ASPA|nr:hypothetical protein MA16_Dca022484 [Dendrobium catenatum]
MVFGKTGKSPLSIATEAIGIASSSVIYNHQNSGRLVVNQQDLLYKSWHPPPPDWIKFNVDASFLCSYKGGVGGVCRDHRGRLLLAFGRSYVHWDIAHVELLAIKTINEVFKDWMLEYNGIINEGDNINIIKLIHKKIKAGMEGMEDLSFTKNFNHVICNWVNRDSNKLVDLCANYAILSSFDWEDVSLNKISPNFLDLLKEELVCCML